MKCLLDTHAFLWWVEDSPKLPRRARTAIARAECFVSVASAWELAIKASLGKVRLASPVARYFQRYTEEAGFRVLGIDLGHVTATEALPHHHGDPFDRLLVAQAAEAGLSIVTRDEAFSRYGIKTIWS